MSSSMSAEEKVRKLHSEVKATDIKPWWRRWLMYMAYHGVLDLHGSMCRQCKQPFPCATIQTLDG